MDIYLDLFAKSLVNIEEPLKENQINRLFQYLETQKINSLYNAYNIELFLHTLQKELNNLSNENLLIFIMIFADFTQKNILSFEDKQKLEVFNQISLKLKVFIFFLFEKSFLKFKRGKNAK